jgi:asparagine synthase (glutamine-hydrolysing)
VQADALGAMNATLAHRGPDSAGTFLDGPVGLAMRRLSIIDLAGGDQPIGNEDGSVTVVQNGEIYNYRELRRDLEGRGHRFSTHSDTEVLVHMYEDLGPGFLERLRGMFAIAIWDANRRRLLLARDRFGIKPLYYRDVGGSLSFASELKALTRHPSFSRELDLDALEAYLQLGWIPAPLSIFRESRKLPAGHALIAEDGEIRIDRYARPAPAPLESLRRESIDDLATELVARLRDSVRAHLVADVPVGVLLSGGLDSSLLAALASGETSGPLKTFSIGFEEQSFNELDKARLVAQRFGSDHHELIVRPSAFEALPTIVDTFDEPFADSSALPTYLVSGLAADEVKVVLTGEGGDELFGGYYTYTADWLAPRVGPLAAAGRRLIERLPSSSGARALDDKLKRFARGARLPPLERHCSWQEVFPAVARDGLLEPERRGSRDPLELYRARYAETRGADELMRLQDLDLGINLVDDQLTKTDRSSMAHSLEARVPMLDPVVSDLALALPAELKFRGFAKKRLLRRAAAPLLPSAILNARKQGFAMPVASWLRGELEPLAREVLAPDILRAQGYFRPEYVTRLIDDHVALRANNSRQIWSLLIFATWGERHAQPTLTAPTTVAPL